MDSLQTQIQRYLKATWQRRWTALGVAWLVCMLGWIGVYMIPNQYESSARVYVDADAVLTPLLRGVAADSAATSQLDVLQRTLLSRPNLQKLISKTDLDLGLAGAEDRERLIQQLSTDIKVKPQTKTLFTIEYRNKDPHLAYNVVQTLLNIFIENATGSNRSDMENARRFLDRQIASYEEQLRAAERRRAEFRSRYLNIIAQDDGQGGVGTSHLDQMRSQVVQLRGQLQDAEVRRDALKQELSKLSATTTSDMGGASGGGEGSKLQQVEEQLRELRLRYTEDHPDVIALRNLAASLRASPPAGGGRSGPRSRTVANTAYEQMRLRLVDTEAQVASLKRQLDEGTKERDQLEELAKQVPGVQAEFKALDRDYSVLKHDYEELLTRREAAQIAQAADTQANKVKLQVIDPPQVPTIPVAPNRLILIPAVLLAGLGAGVPGRHYPHKWRHTYATELVRAGVDIHVVQRLLGHASIASTVGYTHLSLDDLHAGLAGVWT
jgi:polysaccharide chain length determinant protein (PEP-CTERM system associated)